VNLTPATAGTLVVPIVFLLVVLRRAYSLSQGTRFSLPRLLVLPVLVGLLLAITEAESLELVPYYYTIGDAAILVVATWVMTRHVRATVEFSSDPRGGWTYRLGMSAVLVYVGLYLARMALEVLYFPWMLAFTGPPAGSGVSQGSQWLLIGVDVLVAAGTGVLLGRNLGAYLRHKVESRTSNAAGAPPVRSGDS